MTRPRRLPTFWIPGRFTRLGIALTFLGFALVLMTWRRDDRFSCPDETMLWICFPLCGVWECFTRPWIAARSWHCSS